MKYETETEIEEKQPASPPTDSPQLGFAILLSEYLHSCESADHKITTVHCNSPFGSYLEDTNGITVRTDIARNWAKMEMTAIKNRIVLSGLTLTIPLFMYLKVVFWSD